jgi:hypothetical protein
MKTIMGSKKHEETVYESENNKNYWENWDEDSDSGDEDIEHMRLIVRNMVDKGKIDCVYSGWVSAEAKAAGATPIDKVYFTMPESLKLNLVILEHEIINYIDSNGIQFFCNAEQVAEV